MRVIFRQLFFKESVFTAGLKNFIQLKLIGKTKKAGIKMRMAHFLDYIGLYMTMIGPVFFINNKHFILESIGMKKYLAAAALVGAIGLSTITMANARGNYGYGPGAGYGDCNGRRYCENWSSSEKDDEKSSAFFAETREIRKEIVVKRSELDALMQQDNPDEKKVAKLAGDLFDLQNKMEEKAEKTFGDSPRYGYGPGPGNGNCGRRGNW